VSLQRRDRVLKAIVETIVERDDDRFRRQVARVVPNRWSSRTGTNPLSAIHWSWVAKSRGVIAYLAYRECGAGVTW
jgi:hypothetical protein